MTRVGVTILLGDGAPGVPIDRLMDDAAKHAHLGAARHYGPHGDCGYRVFTDGESEEGRPELAALLDELGLSPVHLGHFDEASRPVVVIHLISEEPVH